MAAAVFPEVLGGDVALPARDERGVDVRAAGPARARVAVHDGLAERLGQACGGVGQRRHARRQVSR